jgi:hypothetical protein
MNQTSTLILPVLFTTLVFLVGQKPAGCAEPGDITGQVLDTAGKPVAGIKVSQSWIAEDGRWTTRTGTRTDAGGRFSYKTQYAGGRLMTFDATQEHGAVVTFDAEGAGKPLILKLRPTTLVRGAFTNKGIGREIEKVYVSFKAQGTRMAVAAHRGAPSFVLRLPPGDYGLSVGGVDCQRMSRNITIPADKGAFDLGTIDLKPTIVAQQYGKKPPAWTVTDARGVDADVTLADFKGKWVLLEFWGYW